MSALEQWNGYWQKQNRKSGNSTLKAIFTISSSRLKIAKFAPAWLTSTNCLSNTQQINLALCLLHKAHANEARYQHSTVDSYLKFKCDAMWNSLTFFFLFLCTMFLSCSTHRNISCRTAFAHSLMGNIWHAHLLTFHSYSCWVGVALPLLQYQLLEHYFFWMPIRTPPTPKCEAKKYSSGGGASVSAFDTQQTWKNGRDFYLKCFAIVPEIGEIYGVNPKLMALNDIFMSDMKRKIKIDKFWGNFFFSIFS